MNEMKPVWRVNTGRGVPRDLGSLAYANGMIIGIDSELRSIFENYLGAMENVISYQTTRTKKAKYERINGKMEAIK